MAKRFIRQQMLYGFTILMDSPVDQHGMVHTTLENIKATASIHHLIVQNAIRKEGLLLIIITHYHQYIHTNFKDIIPTTI